MEGSCSLNVTVSTPGLIVSRVSYYVSGSKQYSSFALILESCAFSSSASIILSALFFLLIQTKHCLSVVGRALQGSCPQRSDTQSFLCKHGPDPTQWNRLQGGSESYTGLTRLCQGHGDTSVLSLPVSCVVDVQRRPQISLQSLGSLDLSQGVHCVH